VITSSSEAEHARASDPILRPFLSAANPAESEQHLLRLLDEEAAPAIHRVLQRKAQFSSNGSQSILTSADSASDFDDVCSAAREELIRQLLLAREGKKAEPIANFRAYAAAVAYASWAEHLRHVYPARAMLLNRLRYLLENRTTQRGFALWDGPSGERWCGFEKCRNQLPSPQMSARQQLLLVDPRSALAEEFGGINYQATNLAQLLDHLFRWLGEPIDLRHLVEVVGALLEISDRKESLPAGSEAESLTAPLDPAPSPVDALKWQEYLRWLWQELSHLSLPQCSAFLLHSTVVREFELCGIGSIRQIARLLQMPPETLAELWNDIPLGDLVIAQRLQRERQQVINLRRVARERLARAWKEWSK
jgi:hypothetical protein